MKKSSWMLTAAALSGFAAQGLAQEVKPMPAPAAAPAVTSAPMILSSDCCNSNACCDDGCGRGGSIIADFGFIILSPRWSNNTAGVQVLNSPGDPVVMNTISFEGREQFAPRLSLGAVGANGFGARINWFGFAIGESIVAPPVPGVGGGFFAQFANPTYTGAPLGLLDFNYTGDLVLQNNLRMDVWDFEAVTTGTSGNWSYLAAAGVRYAHIAQEFNSIDYSPAGVIEDVVLSGHNFNGAGPTLALESRRNIRSSGLYGYGNARGAVLFGTAKQAAVRDATLFFDPALVYAQSEENVVIPVGELEVGVGYSREMGRSSAFLQIGFNGQIWGQVGNSSKSSIAPVPGSAPLGFNDDPLPSISSDNSSLGLIGFALRAGLTY